MTFKASPPRHNNPQLCKCTTNVSGGSGGTSYWPLVVCGCRWVIGNNVTPPWLIFTASRGASRPGLTPARDRCKWWLGRGECGSYEQPRKHMWRRLKTGSECRLQVSEDSCRRPGCGRHFISVSCRLTGLLATSCKGYSSWITLREVYYFQL